MKSALKIAPRFTEPSTWASFSYLAGSLANSFPEFAVILTPLGALFAGLGAYLYETGNKPTTPTQPPAMG